MKITIFMILLAVSLQSCTKDLPKVKHVSKTNMIFDRTAVQVINSKDPVCEMSTAKYLEDTAIYKGNILGFCSESCKSKFKKDPEKYVQNEK